MNLEDATRIRTLHRELGSIDAVAKLTGFSPSTVQKLGRHGPLSDAALVRKIADTFGVTVDAMKGSRARGDTILARQAAYYLLRRRGRSYGQIGQIFGGRDHSTIIHGCKRTRERFREDKAFMYKVIGCRR